MPPSAGNSGEYD